MKAPSWFISHGSPDLIVHAEAPAHRFLRGLNARLTDLQGVVAISPHWRTEALTVNVTAPAHIQYDFYGFPEALYRYRWSPVSSDKLNDQVLATLAPLSPQVVTSQALDHGVWAPLSLMDPEGGVPVVAISLPRRFSPRQLFELGATLAPLREQGVAIMGSGSVTHNLREIGPNEAAPPRWAQEFVGWLEEKLAQNDWEALFEYRRLAPNAVQAHPTDEHLTPLFIAAGASHGQYAQRLHASYTYQSLYMGSYEFV
ncbi:class III extradiol ring-cleavage dioxygenase [Hahella sp. HN01]|uniref:DODA-type extradiol aromatic ring-opening family dioxygenase n=1 Tax=Hahella sp. HN01 TaxID=2847262 RepID=UPI001C1EADCC|nr:class III extradiol ring-cleavage dioxygenase [Hahella sp. HN01]MBU6953005.1 dioxygenase [Hahella sp. HN01]